MTKGSGFLHFADLEKDLWTLLSVVGASEKNHDLISSEPVKDHLPHGLWPTEEGIVEEIVISTAVRMRMVEDKFVSKDIEASYPYPPSEMFQLESGSLTKADNKKSGLRVICDKLIHAEEIDYKDYESVVISGTNNKEGWSLEFSLTRYALSGLSLASQYEDTWEVSSRAGEPMVQYIDTDK